MRKVEKEKLEREIDNFHKDLQTWLLKWFPATAKEIRSTLNEKFEQFQNNLRF